MKLTELKRGESAKITKIDLNKNYTKELIALGFSYGNIVVFERNAPLGDPQQYHVAGNYIAIRKKDAAGIEVEKVWRK